ncbi:HNH endonuclease [Dysgonomonas sp. HDW5B]|uniref:HNH endonuclease n=1 Tax=Dysgonomonas sp. HDW5B TaxID=2714927 RepID=UPI00140CB342|nr:HNH endonuclease [Dysgonomonas sp. HDW5B]QIK55117.1 HNH endonuclease [Dysgonomonas sp. HDW5B]
MRNPKWHRDEIILALDLYFRTKPGNISAKNPEVVKLSKILNKLPIHDVFVVNNEFRNPNGVSLKMSNFLAIDPGYPGKGMVSYSKLDAEVFEEFVDSKELLHKLALKIRNAVGNSNLLIQLSKIEDDIEAGYKTKEGSILYKLHKYRERNSAIVKKKKNKYFRENGKLECEVCGFNFNEIYGDLGNGYIECHHKIALSQLDVEAITELDDLALVCANCHRMLHRNMSFMDIRDLKLIVEGTK